MTDTRNWRCLFGMHQMNRVETKLRKHYDETGEGIPLRIVTVYVLQCVHCGKMKHHSVG